MDMNALARFGAAARIAELQKELQELYEAFPDLGPGRKRGRPAKQGVSPLGAVEAGKRKRKPMSAAQRKAVGERMKKYWASRKKEKKG